MRVLAVLVFALFSTQLFADNKGEKEVKELERQLQEKKFSKHYNCMIDGVQVSGRAALEAVPFFAAFGTIKLINSAPGMVPSTGVLLTDAAHDNAKNVFGGLLGEKEGDDILVNFFLGAGSIYIDTYKHIYQVIKGEKSLDDPADLHYTKKNFSGTIASSKDLMELSGDPKSLRCYDLHHQVDVLEGKLADINQESRSQEKFEERKANTSFSSPLYKRQEILAN